MPWHSLFFVKCFFNWGSSFGLTSFWNALWNSYQLLLLLLIGEQCLIWRFHVDYFFLTTLFFHFFWFKLWKSRFLVTALLWSYCFAMKSVQEILLGFKLIFCYCLFVSLLFSKSIFSVFLCYLWLYFLFTDMIIVSAVAKNGYSVKESFSF